MRAFLVCSCGGDCFGAIGSGGVWRIRRFTPPTNEILKQEKVIAC
jgi:hypothetical protein